MYFRDALAGCVMSSILGLDTYEQMVSHGIIWFVLGLHSDPFPFQDSLMTNDNLPHDAVSDIVIVLCL